MSANHSTQRWSDVLRTKALQPRNDVLRGPELPKYRSDVLLFER
ncbi:MAG TPA: hypothetical protein VEM93_09265 [Actinomycetota bacterium]|nr:hypothetical protein [Actinomycetota bacterium]